MSHTAKLVLSLGGYAEPKYRKLFEAYQDGGGDGRAAELWERHERDAIDLLMTPQGAAPSPLDQALSRALGRPVHVKRCARSIEEVRGQRLATLTITGDDVEAPGAPLQWPPDGRACTAAASLLAQVTLREWVHWSAEHAMPLEIRRYLEAAAGLSPSPGTP